MIKVDQNAFEYLSGRSMDLPDFLHSVHIKNVCFDSREIKEGDGFLVLPSVAGNESQYVEKALSQGASVILCGDESLCSNEKCIFVENVMELGAQLLNGALNFPSQSLKCIGITGTNGKSSISFYLAQMLTELKSACAVMGTLGFGHWDRLSETGMTTLPLERLHKSLAEMAEQFSSVAMEVSSHGLDQNRLAGVNFEGAIFSNLSRDHLDYHCTMEAYGEAKGKLFKRPNLKLAVINIDDEYGKQLIQEAQATHIVSYGKTAESDLQFGVTELHVNGMTMWVDWKGEKRDVELPLYGEFNAYNVASVMAYCLSSGYDFDSVIGAVSSLQPVPGRMELVKVRSEQPVVLVDYAHTPDALKQVIAAAKSHNRGNIHLVVGCGGDRDQGKRPLMGKIAVQSADKVIFTSDNPRSESPEQICQHMVEGISESFDVVLDRQEAIEKAVSQSSNEDLVLIAGKGHETYQEANGERTYFSDVQCAKAALQMEKLA